MIIAFSHTFDTMRGVVGCGDTGMVIFSEIDGTLHCSFSERLDGYVCSTFEQELLQRIAEFQNSRENTRIVFDLDGVVFISSAFLRICLIHLKASSKDHFTVTNVSEEIHKVFCVSGFVEIMNVVPRISDFKTPETK